MEPRKRKGTIKKKISEINKNLLTKAPRSSKALKLLIRSLGSQALKKGKGHKSLGSIILSLSLMQKFVRDELSLKKYTNKKQTLGLFRNTFVLPYFLLRFFSLNRLPFVLKKYSRGTQVHRVPISLRPDSWLAHLSKQLCKSKPRGHSSVELPQLLYLALFRNSGPLVGALSHAKAELKQAKFLDDFRWKKAQNSRKKEKAKA